MDETTITSAFISQYRAALAMFRNAVGAIPPARWNDSADLNRTWRIAHHTLHFTHLYLTGTEEGFDPWVPALRGAERLENPLPAPNDRSLADGACSQSAMIAYADAIEAMLPRLVASRPYDGPSGFAWIEVGRYEHHIRNLRHLQHHTGQLAERARASGGDGLKWSGAVVTSDVSGH